MEWNWFYAASSKAASIQRHLKGLPPPLLPPSHSPPTQRKNDYSYISFPPTPSILSATSRGVVIATPTPPLNVRARSWRMKPHAASVSCACQRAPVIFAVSHATVGAAALEIIEWLVWLAAALRRIPSNTQRPTDSAASTGKHDAFIYYCALFLESCVCVCVAN